MSAVLVVGLALLAGTLGGAAALALRGRRSRRTAPAAAPALQGQLLFAAPVGRGTVGLDCLLHRTSQAGLPGRPVHLVVALPDSPALAAREREQLRTWLEGSEAVDVELSLADAHPQVTLACNATVLTLDLPVG